MIPKMRALLVLALLVACGDDAPVFNDARPADVAYAPPINWNEFGAPCERSRFGAVGCRGTEGGGGVCVLDVGTGPLPDGPEPYPAHCQPTCRAIFYMHECPPDAAAVFDGYHSQGCWCVRK